VVVPVTLVLGVPVSVVHEVRVAVVGYGDMAAVRAVLVFVSLVDRVFPAGALVDMVLVDAVDMSVMGVVGVVGVWNCDMPATTFVGVLVAGVGLVVDGSGHRSAPC
jgi:hypothetical protein